MDLVQRFTSTFFEVIFYILGEFLPAVLAIGFLLTLVVGGSALAIKHYHQKDYNEQATRWNAIKQVADKLITELPTKEELYDEFMLHSVLASPMMTVYRKKFDTITSKLEEAQSRHARELEKHKYQIPKTFSSLIDSHNEYYTIVAILRAYSNDIATLWREIDEQSVEVVEPAIIEAAKTPTPHRPLPRVRPGGPRGGPLIYDDTYGADVINGCLLRMVYRKELDPNMNKKR